MSKHAYRPQTENDQWHCVCGETFNQEVQLDLHVAMGGKIGETMPHEPPQLVGLAERDQFRSLLSEALGALRIARGTIVHYQGETSGKGFDDLTTRIEGALR